jgi:hypothetical protein
MSDTPSNQHNFYIGWHEKAPKPYARTVGRFVGATLILVVLTAALLVLTQRGFVNSVFELGTLSTHEGLLVKKPVPMLKVQTGINANGTPEYNSMLLIGFGKFGAEATLAEIEEEQEQDLEGKTIQLEGTLIHYQGKRALELTKGAAAFAGFGENTSRYQLKKTEIGDVSLRGEILDPKCALGVMKPGYGKPHRSCAVRCLSGGIPPVMRISNQNGATNYCIVVGEDGQLVNQELLDYVADQVQLCGRLEQQDDWLVLYTNPASDLNRLKPYWMSGEVPMCN